MYRLRHAGLLHQHRRLRSGDGGRIHLLFYHIRQKAAHIRHQRFPALHADAGIDPPLLFPPIATVGKALAVKPPAGQRLSQRVRQQRQRQ